VAGRRSGGAGSLFRYQSHSEGAAGAIGLHDLHLGIDRPAQRGADCAWSFANALLFFSNLLGLGPESGMLAATSLCFDISGLEIFGPLISGAPVAIASGRMAANPLEWIKLLRDEIRVAQATPSALRVLAEAAYPLPSGSTILSGGEALPAALANYLCTASAWNVYGPTETTIWSLTHRLRAGDERIAIGAPIANTEIHVLDEAMRPVPVGVAGELYIGGAGLARGYWNRASLTAERFVPAPFRGQPGRRLYRTGDQVRYLADGSLEFLGRLDQQVKVRGFRIELGEIEAVLNEFPGVRQSVAALRQVDGSQRIVAYIVPTGAPPAIPELRLFLQQKLPDHMIPSAFISISELPLTPNGKLDRKALPEPLPGLAGPAVYQSAQTPLEQQMVEIWISVLGISRLGVHDNFFALGGDSIACLRVLSRCLRAGMSLDLPVFFQHQTIAELAQFLEANGHTPSMAAEVCAQAQVAATAGAGWQPTQEAQ
jgi:acyl-CoA synthetase (AMP-forming)/AMP-acid ligase II/aryl carrier-like protein